MNLPRGAPAANDFAPQERGHAVTVPACPRRTGAKSKLGGLTKSADTGSDEAETALARPVLRVVRGRPTPEELAALVAVVLSRIEPEGRRRAAAGWAARGNQLRRPLRNAPGAWRSSALP